MMTVKPITKTVIRGDKQFVILEPASQDAILSPAPDPKEEARLLQKDHALVKILRGRLSMEEKTPPVPKIDPRWIAAVVIPLVVLFLCTLVGGLPLLLAFLKWGWGVIVLIVSVGGLTGLCCLTLIVLIAAGYLAYILGFIKTPGRTPKKKTSPTQVEK